MQDMEGYIYLRKVTFFMHSYVLSRRGYLTLQYSQHFDFLAYVMLYKGESCYLAAGGVRFWWGSPFFSSSRKPGGVLGSEIYGGITPDPENRDPTEQRFA